MSLLAGVQRDLLEGKPLPDLLRKCMLLGSESGSSELRAWATRELKGYSDEDEVPDYRIIPAQIKADATTGNAIVTGQTIGLSMIPEWATEYIGNQVKLYQGVGELESLAESGREAGKSPQMLLPAWESIGAAVDRASQNPFQHIHALYWSISPSGISGALDAVRTALAELLAELGSTMPGDQDEPTADQVTRALHVATGGGNATITIAAPVTTVHASDSASVQGVSGGQTGAAGQDLHQIADQQAAFDSARLQQWLGLYRKALPEIDDGLRSVVAQQIEQVGTEIEKAEPRPFIVKTLADSLRSFAQSAVSAAGSGVGTLGLAEVLANWPFH